MSKVQLSPRRLLELVRHGIRAGSYQAAVDIIDDCIEQLPPDALFTVEAGESRSDGEHGISQRTSNAVSEREPKDNADLDTLQAQLGTLREALKEIRDEMHRHAQNAFQIPGPDVVTAPQVTRWVDRLSALLRDET